MRKKRIGIHGTSIYYIYLHFWLIFHGKCTYVNMPLPWIRWKGMNLQDMMGLISRRCPLCPPASAIFPLLYRQRPVETYWQPMTSLWSMGLERTHERGEKSWLFAQVALYPEFIYIRCKHISRHFMGFKGFLKSPTYAGWPVNQPEFHVSCHFFRLRGWANHP